MSLFQVLCCGITQRLLSVGSVQGISFLRLCAHVLPGHPSDSRASLSLPLGNLACVPLPGALPTHWPFSRGVTPWILIYISECSGPSEWSPRYSPHSSFQGLLFCLSHCCHYLSVLSLPELRFWALLEEL